MGAKGKGSLIESVSAATMPSEIGSQLQEEVNAASHLIIFYPKFHCEFVDKTKW